jgi:hypothetical protein
MNPNIERTPLEIAESVLLDAGSAIRARLEEHGHTERSFKMIADLWSTYIGHAYTIRGETQLRPQDIPMLMDLMKTARSVYGYSPDNFTDKAGYSSLAAMITPQPKSNVIKMGEKSMEELFPKSAAE